MAMTSVKAARVAKLCFGFFLLGGVFASASNAFAQYPLQYPTQSEVSKDGTTILLEDYANPPPGFVAGGRNYADDFERFRVRLKFGYTL